MKLLRNLYHIVCYLSLIFLGLTIIAASIQTKFLVELGNELPFVLLIVGVFLTLLGSCGFFLSTPKRKIRVIQKECFTLDVSEVLIEKTLYERCKEVFPMYTIEVQVYLKPRQVNLELLAKLVPEPLQPLFIERLENEVLPFFKKIGVNCAIQTDIRFT